MSAYEIGALLGQGSAGVVHRARGPDGRDVAVKVLKKVDAETLAKFERERRLLAAVGEGFVPLIDSGSTELGPFIVMPYLPGGTLRARLAKGPLAIGETLALGRTLAASLGRAHARGIVHRDMKPENVLFDGTGAPLIADLGIAKHFDHEAPGASQSVAITRDGITKGTFGYMAPEQMKDAKTAGPPADVFSLGAVLYECLAWEPAFTAETFMGVVRAVVEGEFIPLTQARPDVPQALAAVIERALAGDPEARWADGAAFAEALIALRREGPARPRSPLVAVAGAGGVLLVAALVALLVALAVTRRSQGAGEPVVAPVTTAATAVGAPLRAEAVAKLLALARSGRFAGSSLDEEATAIELARGAAPENVALVASALDSVTAELRAALREVYLEARMPTAEEARSTLEGDLAGLDVALDRAEALGPGAPLDAATGALLARAERRVEARAARAQPPGAAPPSFRVVVAERQTRLLSPAALSLARVAVLALGRVDGAVAREALARHLVAEHADARAIPVALAVARLGGESAERALTAMRKRYGLASRFWREVRPALRGEPSTAIETAPSLLERAAVAFEHGDSEETRRLCDQAIVLEPGSAAAWLLRGKAQGKLLDHSRSIVDYTRSLALDDRNPEAWTCRASERLDARDRHGALTDVNRALELDPKLAVAWEVKAFVLRDLDEHRDAIAAATRALELEPTRHKSFQVRGISRAALGEREAAIADLEECLRLGPGTRSADKVRQLLADLRKTN